MRIIIDSGDVDEQIVKSRQKEVKLGGKLTIAGVGGEFSLTPANLQQDVEYTKAKGRLYKGRLYMFEDYSDMTVQPFDPQTYFTNVVQEYLQEIFNEVTRKLSEGFNATVEGGKNVLRSTKSSLETAVGATVGALKWTFQNVPLPDTAPSLYQPLDDRVRAGRPHYGVGGFFLYDNEQEGALAEPAQLEIRYDDEEIVGFLESDLRLYRWDEELGDFEALPGTLDTTANRMTATITRLGLFTLGAVMPARAFTWTVVGAVTVGTGADQTTTVTLESSPIRTNTGGIVPAGTLVHARSVDAASINDPGAPLVGTMSTADAAPDIDGPQVATGPDGVARVTYVVPGRPGALFLQAFTDIGTADGSAVVALPPQ
jgi:hypothetical protein